MDICVTGASKGLGYALTAECVRRGHRVWAVARSVASLDASISRAGGRLFVSSVDVASAESVAGWKKEMESRGFTPECVILNASVQVEDLKDGFSAESAAQNIDVNLTGSLRCVEALLPAMLAIKKGSFVAISSTASLRPSDRSAGYSASKAGLAMALRSLRLRFGSLGVRFAEVVLGPIATDMWEGRKSALVPAPELAAKEIVDFALGGGRRLFYPFFTTLLLRLSLWLPDRIFASVSAAVLK